MRYLSNYFYKSQIDKIFICFPDPHFKAKNHRRRIISHELLSEYAYFLKPGGRLYTVTGMTMMMTMMLMMTLMLTMMMRMMVMMTNIYRCRRIVQVASREM
jgi:tRNA (guanine-N7-)-methyltransferase